MSQLKINGIYKHFKGNEYRILCNAMHTETAENMVVYQSIRTNAWYVRPEVIFNEIVKNKKKMIKRFKFTGDYWVDK